eukprot:m.13812 g.13812  ORF g.13812 m.13812 type:complete len:357 (+) comp4930_c0_seq1:43-1113(+)
MLSARLFQALVLVSYYVVVVVSVSPVVYKQETFKVNVTSNIPYAKAVYCSVSPDPSYPTANITPTKTCPNPTIRPLLLDLYTPMNATQLGPRPAFIATHSGGYAVNDKLGYKNEMQKACEYFASRGYICISMNYRLTDRSGGGLAPKNWSGLPSPLHAPSWQGGFNPALQAVYCGVRDTKASIRWLRAQGVSGALPLAQEFFGAGGWSAGACTTVHLVTGYDWDFTTEMDMDSDPTFNTIHANLGLSSLVNAGVVWAGNAVVTDQKDVLDGGNRFADKAHPVRPVAMYRGTEDGTMTPWAQQEVQAKYNATGHVCDLYTAIGVSHTSLFPDGNISGIPVMNHSYTWISAALNLTVV